MAFPFPSFKNPPVNEVAIGLEFENLDRLLIPHFGLFWAQIKSEFPTAQHASPFTGGQIASDGATGLPLPRIWFVDQSEERLLQLQSTRIVFNWRRRPDREYPRYSVIAKQFFEYLNVFEAFVAKHDVGILKPLSAELSYVNVVPRKPEGKVTEEAASLLKDFQWQDFAGRFLTAPQTIAWSATFPLPAENGQLIVKLDDAKLVADQSSVLKLELTANTKFPSGKTANVHEWFDLAHEWIVKGFVDLTSDRAHQELWRREQ